MGTTKHTKGEWNIYRPDFEHINIGTSTRFICEMPTGEFDEDDERQESEANAKLIAAAPELLDALTGTMNALSRMIEKYNADSIEAEWIGEANEAIRKATI